MKKQILTAMLLIGGAITIHAQDVLDKVAEGSCSCVKQIDRSLKGDDLETQLGLCIVQQFSQHNDELKRQYHVTVDDLGTSKGKKLAEQVGVKMVSKCPDEMVRIVANSKASEGDGQAAAAGSTTGSFDGASVNDIIQGQYATVLVRDGSGREQKLLWLEYFDGSDLLKDGASAVKGKKFKIDYVEKEIYNPTLRDYVKTKVITRVAVK